MFKNTRICIRRILSYIWNHYDYLLEPFYPIVQDFGVIQNLRNSKCQTRYIFTFLAGLYFFLDTVVVYYKFGLDVKNPYFIPHISLGFVPEFVRSKIDIAFPVSALMSMIMFYGLIWERNPQLIHTMFTLPHNTRFLFSIVETKIDFRLMKALNIFWDKVKNKLGNLQKILELQFQFPLTLFLVIFEFYRIFYVEGYQTKYRVWFVALYCLVVIHNFTIIVTMGVYFIITNMILNIKQRHIMFLLQKSMKHKLEFQNLDFVLKKILRYTQEMNDYNAFYSKYMTTTIVGYCFLGCLNFNLAISLPESEWISSIFWATFSVNYLICISCFCAVSSNKISINGKIFQELQVLKISLCNSEIGLSAREIVHLELVNEYKTLLHTTCFRILTKTPFNNRLYLFQLPRYIFMIYFKVAHKF